MTKISLNKKIRNFLASCSHVASGSHRIQHSDRGFLTLLTSSDSVVGFIAMIPKLRANVPVKHNTRQLYRYIVAKDAHKPSRFS